jgi:hypothetical protein
MVIKNTPLGLLLDQSYLTRVEKELDMRKYPALGVSSLCLVLASLVLLYPNPFPITSASVVQQERVIDMKVPLNSPLTIIEVRNLQSDNFLRDMEIVVKNTSPKPICYIATGMRFPDLITPETGRAYGFPVDFGAEKLLTPGQLASPEDPRINPGETYVLKVPDSIWKGFDIYRRTHKADQPTILKVQLIIQIVRFGDGTGYNFSSYVGPGKTSINHSRPTNKTDSNALKDRTNIFANSLSPLIKSLASTSKLTLNTTQLSTYSVDGCASGCSGKYDTIRLDIAILLIICALIDMSHTFQKALV